MLIALRHWWRLHLVGCWLHWVAGALGGELNLIWV